MRASVTNAGAGWAETKHKLCNWNQNGQNGEPIGRTVDACKQACAAASSCWGFAYTNEGTKQCIQCTGADRILTTDDGKWDVYAKPTSTTTKSPGASATYCCDVARPAREPGLRVPPPYDNASIYKRVEHGPAKLEPHVHSRM